jgi:CRISPR-associated protein Csb1
MIDGLGDEARLVVSAQLSPTVGSTFQPTGFPDLGPAEFERPLQGGGAQRALLVESVQSMANHLESTAWDAMENRPVEALSRLPYMEVRDAEDRFLTSSRTEPHRLAGAYVKDAAIDGRPVGEWMVEQLGVEQGLPIDWRAIYRGIFGLDPLCLVHGIFFSDPLWKVHGNPRVRRAVTAVVEARGVAPMVSGGVKRDDVNPTVDRNRTSKEGYGYVPFGRTDYTAAEIVLDAVVDLEQIRGYGLDAAESDLLVAVALWELRTLLDGPLRLRTACDLDVARVEVRRPDGWSLPSSTELAARIAASAPKAGSGPRTVRWSKR